MSNALTHNVGTFIAAIPADTKAAAPLAESPQPEAPVGYRWVSRHWRVLADGTRDYAAYHGKTAFNFLLPVSSKLHRRR